MMEDRTITAASGSSSSRNSSASAIMRRISRICRQVVKGIDVRHATADQIRAEVAEG
jgi:hypothetical protein